MSCHSERSEESEKRQFMFFSLCSTTRQILRDAQNDTLIGNFYFDTPSSFIFVTKNRCLRMF